MLYTGKTKKLKRRSIPSIALRKSNEYVGQLFMSIYTGKEVYSDYRVELPIDYDFSKRV